MAALSCSHDNVANPVKIGPRLSIPDSTFNFGFVPQGAVISHTFWLHSTGNETVTIVKIVPG